MIDYEMDDYVEDFENYVADKMDVLNNLLS